MAMKTLITTRAGNYARCKQQHVAAGYRIENEQTRRTTASALL